MHQPFKLIPDTLRSYLNFIYINKLRNYKKTMYIFPFLNIVLVCIIFMLGYQANNIAAGIPVAIILIAVSVVHIITIRMNNKQKK